MRNIFEKIKKEAEKFPNVPGVYFFRDKNKKPIYIGRAGLLKKRITSYFRAADPRIREMIDSARSLDFKKTATLLEAVILEANLIKKHWPKYNVRERDNRSFVYLAVLNGEFPKLIIARGRELEGMRRRAIHMPVFGPYQSYRLLKVALGLVRKIFPFSDCKSNSGRACFDYQIGLCPGVCIGAIKSEEYRKNIKNLILFFRGEKKKLLKELKRENPEKIKALQHIADAALLASSEIVVESAARESIYGRIEGYDISHLSGKRPVGAMVVFRGGEKDPSQYRLFKIKGGENYNDLEMLKEVLERRLRHSEWPLPKIIFVDGGLNQVKAMRDALKQRHIFIPVVGLAKSAGHSASAYAADKLVIANIRKSGKELLIASKKLFQEIRNEAHRVAIRFNRRLTKFA